jgi:hypothetical protein
MEGNELELGIDRWKISRVSCVNVSYCSRLLHVAN